MPDEDPVYNAMLKLRNGIAALREAGESWDEIRDHFESEVEQMIEDE